MKRQLVRLAIAILAIAIVQIGQMSRSHAAPRQGSRQAAPPSAPIKGLEANSAVDQSPSQILTSLRSSFRADIGQHLGLSSAAEVAQAEVQPGLRMAFVRLDALRAYDGQSPARALIVEQPMLTRLVVVGDRARSSIVVANRGGSWQTVQFGDTVLAEAIDRATRSLMQNEGVAREALFLVRIPAMRLDFLAYETSSSLRLTPLFDSAQLGLSAGKPAPAEAVLASLVAAAQQVPTARPRP